MVVARVEDLPDVLQQRVWIGVLFRPARDRPHDLVSEWSGQGQDLGSETGQRRCRPSPRSHPEDLPPPSRSGLVLNAT